MAAPLPAGSAAGAWWRRCCPGFRWPWDTSGVSWMRTNCAGTTASPTPIWRRRQGRRVQPIRHGFSPILTDKAGLNPLTSLIGYRLYSARLGGRVVILEAEKSMNSISLRNVVLICAIVISLIASAFGLPDPQPGTADPQPGTRIQRVENAIPPISLWP